MFGDQF